jgi:3-hydroxybutyryl-CoA dehydrogenase
MSEAIQIRTVAVAGAGTMGAGIAQVCAQAGYKVLLFDIQENMLQTAGGNIRTSLEKLVSLGKLEQQASETIFANITFTAQIKDLHADLVIEAIVEKAEPKAQLFQQLIELNGPGTIYATNTSSIPITQIAAKVSVPQQVVGIHFFNPAQIMKLVEVIKGAKTDAKVVNAACKFVLSLRKEPVIAADSPGFIVNRVARLYYVESLKMLEENVAGFETIDRIMESSGFKMGPFRLMDLIGVDTNYSVTESQYQLFNFEPRFRPSRIQKQKVDAGLHGKKTKGGFYSYE